MRKKKFIERRDRAAKRASALADRHCLWMIDLFNASKKLEELEPKAENLKRLGELERIALLGDWAQR